MSLDVRRIADWAQAEVHRDAWNALVTDSAGGSLAAVPSLFQTFEWNHSWWRAFGKGHELLLLGAFEGERLVGVAPLLIGRKSKPIPSKVIRIIGGQNFASDFCAFICAPNREDVLSAFGDWLDAHPGLWNELEFMNVLGDSPEFAFLEKRYGGASGKTEVLFLYDAPTRVLGAGADDAENKDLVSRDSLKRHFNWFKKQGVLTFGHRDSADEIHARLDSFFEQHIQRRSITPDPSQFSDEREREFYRILVDTLGPKGWLRFFTVELDGAPIAYHFGFEFAGKFYWYKPTFDIKYVKKSPGEVLLKTLFEYAIERQLKEFDFTAGSEGFKYRFSNHVRKLYRYRAFRSWPQYAMHRAETQSRALALQMLSPFRKKPVEKRASE